MLSVLACREVMTSPRESGFDNRGFSSATGSRGLLGMRFSFNTILQSPNMQASSYADAPYNRNEYCS